MYHQEKEIIAKYLDIARNVDRTLDFNQFLAF